MKLCALSIRLFRLDGRTALCLSGAHSVPVIKTSGIVRDALRRRKSGVVHSLAPRKFINLDDIPCRQHHIRAVSYQGVCSRGVRVTDISGNGKNIPALNQRTASGYKRTGLRVCLNDKRSESQAADYAVADGKIPAVGMGAGRKFTDHRTVGGNTVHESFVL